MLVALESLLVSFKVLMGKNEVDRNLVKDDILSKVDIELLHEVRESEHGVISKISERIIEKYFEDEDDGDYAMELE